MGAGLLAYRGARRWFLRWGATPGEVGDVLPGDEILPRAVMVTTRAVTIDAPPEAVWPWLVQMGQDRGGFYSYDWLESLFGLQFHNATQVVPGWQHLAVGDQMRAAPAGAGPEAGFTVVRVDPGRAIVTAIGDPERILPLVKAGALRDGGTWAFVLREAGPGRTRLLVRLRATFDAPRPLAWIIERLLEPVHFVMERKQLITLRELAGPGPAGQNGPSGPTGAVVSPGSASTG